MSLKEKIENKIKEWILKKAIKKAIIRMAQLIVSYATAKQIKFSAVFFGFEIDLSDVEKMTIFLMGVFEIFRNWVKVKYPKYFGWL